MLAQRQDRHQPSIDLGLSKSAAGGVLMSVARPILKQRTTSFFMGDKSPKAVNKKAGQKQAEKKSANQKRDQAVAAKQTNKK
jgi:hypothetical protein